MRINSIIGFNYNTQPTDETQKTPELPAAADDEHGNAQNIPSESDYKDMSKMSNNGKVSGANNFNISASKPEDGSAELTKRLVAAKGQFEVRQIIAGANKNLISLRMTAAVLKGDDAALARSYIKKLEKLLSRADRKLMDLDKEDMLRLQRVRAEQQKQKQRAEEIKTELRKKQIERKKREEGYLHEDSQDKISGTKGSNNNPMMNQDVVSEAAITIQAETIAAAETAVVDIGSADGGVSAEVSAGTSGADTSAVDVSTVGSAEISV